VLGAADESAQVLSDEARTEERHGLVCVVMRRDGKLPTLSYRCIWRRTRLSAEGFRCDTTNATAAEETGAAVQLTVA
jgi:hypothetical protein